MQPFDRRQAGELGPTVVATSGEERGMAHETLDLNGIDAGVEQIRAKGAPAVMGAEVAHPGGPGLAVDLSVDRLGG